MIYTSNYKNCGDGRCISISGDRGKEANWKGPSYTKLAPKRDWWVMWETVKDRIDFHQSTTFYIEKYYTTVLSHLDPQEVYNELDGYILLCYEEPEYFCHRHIVAAWLEKTLGVRVPEVKVLGDKMYMIKRPSYVDDILDTIMNLHNENDKVLVKSDSNLHN